MGHPRKVRVMNGHHDGPPVGLLSLWWSLNQVWFNIFGRPAFFLENSNPVVAVGQISFSRVFPHQSNNLEAVL